MEESINAEIRSFIPIYGVRKVRYMLMLIKNANKVRAVKYHYISITGPKYASLAIPTT